MGEYGDCTLCGKTHMFTNICMGVKKKLCLGSAEPPIHPQHLAVMHDYENWQLIDLYVDHPEVIKMDATKLEYPDNFIEHIYASHLLEHLSHKQIPYTLHHWYDKLKVGGRLTINVPDLLWASRQVIKYENMQPLTSSVYTEFEGNNGLQSIFYGTHSHGGEYHKAGFTKRSLKALLESAKFKDITIDCMYDGHDMGVLFATALK